MEMPLEIRARNKGRAVVHSVHAKRSIIIPPRSEAHIPVHHTSLPDRDFFFEPDQSQLSLYAHLVDAFMTAVIAKNDSDQAVKVPRNLRLGTVQEADFDNCYHITSGKADVAELATRRPKQEHQKSWLKRVFSKIVTALAIALLATAVPSPTSTSEAIVTSGISIPQPAPEIIITLEIPTSQSIPRISPPSVPEIVVLPTEADLIMPNGVTVYEGDASIQAVVDEYSQLWQEEGFADIPQEE